jgi:two-component system response regulator FixJ
MTMSQIVHVIDDDPVVCSSIRLFLATEGIESRTYSSAQQFLAAIGHDERGCVITDVRLPAMSGVDLLAQVQARGLNLPVILITGQGDIPLAVDAMKKGAADFMEKPVNDALLLASVRKALDRQVVDPERGASAQEIRSRLATLTIREQDVVERLVDGKSNRVIADELGISSRTVEIHRANIMRKTQAASLPALVRMLLAVTDRHSWPKVSPSFSAGLRSSGPQRDA